MILVLAVVAEVRTARTGWPAEAVSSARDSRVLSRKKLSECALNSLRFHAGRNEEIGDGNCLWAAD